MLSMIRPRFFYGWWIVLAAGVATFVSSAFGGVLQSVVLRPMTDEFGWTRSEFTFANTIASILAAFSGLVVGPMVDRRGARPLMLFGSLVFGVTLLATALVTELWQFVALRLVAGVLAGPLIAGVVVNVSVSKWFVRRRGWAISLSSSGFSFATMIMPVAGTAAVTAFGWRGAYVILAMFFWALMLPAALIMRREPEDYGLLPDGQHPGEARTEAERQQVERVRRDLDESYTRHDALRTPAFWMLTLTFGVFVGANIAMLFHAIPYMTGAGFTSTQAGFALATTGISGLVAKFVWGAALQGMHRFGARQFSALAALCAGASTLLMVVATANRSLPVALVACLLWGFGFGSVTPLSEFMWAGYFGRRHLGAVRSASTPFSVGATAAGPLLVAVWFDVAGSYNGAFVAMTIVYALVAVIVLVSREPPPRLAPEP
ncbi:MAG: hypothetical protein CVU47_00575 [Chloroflexi bacterium HGW-Chloroflexi-9]|nr:MAG: hypothetical protein CVU47_00575 [Chloroflexi bacterium HGW-Chloroflexi-9]